MPLYHILKHLYMSKSGSINTLPTQKENRHRVVRKRRRKMYTLCVHSCNAEVKFYLELGQVIKFTFKKKAAAESSTACTGKMRSECNNSRRRRKKFRTIKSDKLATKETNRNKRRRRQSVRRCLRLRLRCDEVHTFTHRIKPIAFVVVVAGDNNSVEWEKNTQWKSNLCHCTQLHFRTHTHTIHKMVRK